MIIHFFFNDLSIFKSSSQACDHIRLVTIQNIKFLCPTHYFFSLCLNFGQKISFIRQHDSIYGKKQHCKMFLIFGVQVSYIVAIQFFKNIDQFLKQINNAMIVPDRTLLQMPARISLWHATQSYTINKNLLSNSASGGHPEDRHPPHVHPHQPEQRRRRIAA